MSQRPDTHTVTPAELYLSVSRAISKRERHLRQQVRDAQGPLKKLRSFRDALINCEPTDPLGLESLSISPEVRDLIDNPPSESGLL